MERKLLIIAFLFLFSALTAAQNKGSLRGFITDSTNGEVLAYCNILIENTKMGSSTDANGFFSIPSVPAGEHILLVTYMGYKPGRVPFTISPGQKTELRVQLPPTSIEYGEVIKIGKAIRNPNETDAGRINLTGREVQLIPKGVEADVIRSLQTIPGVKTSNDISSRYYVRGGGSDQNLVQLDGVTIYNPFHALGIFSIVDPEIINNVQFYKGTFPAEYGGRLSSVMVIKTNDGNKNRFGGSANVSLLTGKVSLEGPIPDGSFIMTGRKSYFGDVMKNFLNNKQAPFDFYDLSFKLNYANEEFLNNSKFTAHTLLSNDNIRYNDPTLADYTFRNNLFGIDYYQVWEKPLYSLISFSFSRYSAEVLPNQSSSKPRKNDISDFAWNTDFTYLFESKDELSFGLQIKTLRSEFAFQNRLGNQYSYNDYGGNFDTYIKYKFLRFENLGVDAGIRIVPFYISEKTAQVLYPRLNATYRIFPQMALKAAYGRYNQEIIAYSDDNDVVSIFEPYLIVPAYLPPSTSDQYMAGLEFNFTDNLLIQIESYYKLLHNTVDINRDKIDASDYDLVSSQGKSYGVEFSSKYTDERIYFSFAYSLSWAKKEVNGVEYAPKYDSRNTANILFGYDFGSGWRASAVFTFSSGRPFTPTAGYYDKLYLNNLFDENYLYQSYMPYTILGSLNAYRLPVYHRLDLSLSKEFNLYFMKFVVEGNIINVYDRKNIFYFDRETGERVNMLPILPTVSLKVEI